MLAQGSPTFAFPALDSYVFGPQGVTLPGGRVLAEPFFTMMRAVERPRDEIQALLRSLKPELDAARAERGTGPEQRPNSMAHSAEEQIALCRDTRCESSVGFEIGLDDIVIEVVRQVILLGQRSQTRREEVELARVRHLMHEHAAHQGFKREFAIDTAGPPHAP